MMSNEKSFLSDLNIHVPKLISVPLQNNEADPEVGWNVSRKWQADTTYAAMAAKIIVAHMHLGSKNNGVQVELLSNDNGFLSYRPYFFTQRTLLARFQVNTTSPPHVHFVRKPIYTLMGLLSLLGEQFVTIPFSGSRTIGGLATVHFPQRGHRNHHNSTCTQLTVLLYNSADTRTVRKIDDVAINLTSLGPTLQGMKYVVYRLDNHHGNAYVKWKRAGAPETPNITVFSELHANEEPWRLEGPTTVTNLVFSWQLPLPGVLVFHACSASLQPPGQVTELKVMNITCGQVLIVWDDAAVNTKCIKTYEVEHAAVGEGFHRINPVDIIFNVFVYLPIQHVSVRSIQLHSGGNCGIAAGVYRVRAVDYWLRHGPYSQHVPYS